MFSFKSAILVATALATLAAATPTASMTRRTTPASSCSTSSLTCCDSSGTAKDAAIAGLLATLGIVDVGDIDALIGATCSPITVIGAGSASCSANALCCDNNSFHGVVALGCVPVDLSL